VGFERDVGIVSHVGLKRHVGFERSARRELIQVFLPAPGQATACPVSFCYNERCCHLRAAYV
jgi:hypothetical protein